MKKHWTTHSIAFATAAFWLGQAAAQDQTSDCGWPEGSACCAVNGAPWCGVNLTCVDNICRDFSQPTAIDKLPVMTMDLLITSCNDSSEILMGGSGPIYWVDLGTGSKFHIESPSHLFQAGAIDEVGLRVPGVRSLADIQSLTFGIQNADMCISKLELVVNDWSIYQKTFDTPLHLVGSRYPIELDQFTIPGEDLRNVWRKYDTSQICAIPSGISGQALQRAITGVLGDALWSASGSSSGKTRINDASFGGGDYVNTSQGQNGALHVDARFHAAINYSVGSELGVDANVTVRIGFDITPTCASSDPNKADSNSVSLGVSPITVQGVDGDNVVVDAILGIVNPESAIAGGINANLQAVKDSFGNVVDGLTVCPSFEVQNSSPAGISIVIDPLLLAFAQQNGADLSICR